MADAASRSAGIRLGRAYTALLRSSQRSGCALFSTQSQRLSCRPLAKCSNIARWISTTIRTSSSRLLSAPTEDLEPSHQFDLGRIARWSCQSSPSHTKWPWPLILRKDAAPIAETITAKTASPRRQLAMSKRSPLRHTHTVTTNAPAHQSKTVNAPKALERFTG